MKMEDDVRRTQFDQRWKTMVEDGAAFGKTERRLAIRSNRAMFDNGGDGARHEIEENFEQARAMRKAKIKF